MTVHSFVWTGDEPGRLNYTYLVFGRNYSDEELTNAALLVKPPRGRVAAGRPVPLIRPDEDFELALKLEHAPDWYDIWLVFRDSLGRQWRVDTRTRKVRRYFLSF